MKAECLIDLMAEKDYINYYSIGLHQMPKMFQIENEMGEEFGAKFFESIKKDENYFICCSNLAMSRFTFITKEAIKEWLEKFSDNEEEEIKWRRYDEIDSMIFEYAKELGFDIDYCYYGIRIINKKIKNKRLEEEEKKKQEAIDLLDSILGD